MLFFVRWEPQDFENESGLAVISQHVVPVEGAPGVGPPPSSAHSGPAANIPNRAVAGTLVAGLARQKPLSSVLLAHRRQREADPPPGLAA